MFMDYHVHFQHYMDNTIAKMILPGMNLTFNVDMDFFILSC